MENAVEHFKNKAAELVPRKPLRFATKENVSDLEVIFPILMNTQTNLARRKETFTYSSRPTLPQRRSASHAVERGEIVSDGRYLLPLLKLEPV